MKIKLVSLTKDGNLIVDNNRLQKVIVTKECVNDGKKPDVIKSGAKRSAKKTQHIQHVNDDKSAS